MDKTRIEWVKVEDIARMQLNKEKGALELGKVTWHSGRIRAATEVARMTW